MVAAGSATVDNHHGGDVGHSIEREHALIRELINGTLPDAAWASEADREVWRRMAPIAHGDV